MHNPGKLFCGLLLALSLGLTSGWAGAQDYPNKPIKIIVAFPPGNAADIVARVLAEQLSPRLGQPVVVENRAGASGTIAAMAVVKSPADGYTLLMTSTSFAINAAVLANLPYDLERDFAPISMVNAIPAVLIVNKSFPADNIQQFLAEIKRNPGKYTYGHPGAGTMQNLAMKLFLNDTGTDIRDVAYKGSVQAVTDIMSGNLDMMFESGNSAANFVKTGRVKAIATSGPTRYFGMPEVPTVMESGLQFSVVGWTAMAAPANTPIAIVNRLNRELREILELPAVRERMVTLGFGIFPQNPPDEVRKAILAESRRWIAVAKAANIPKE